jgi:hypothetical protein
MVIARYSHGRRPNTQQGSSKNQDPNKARMATARKPSDKVGQQAAAPSL